MLIHSPDVKYTNLNKITNGIGTKQVLLQFVQVRIQKMRSNLEEKLMKRMALVHRKAEEWRAAARQQHLERIQKTPEQASKMMNGHNPLFSSHACCGCFPCNNI